MSVNCFGSVKMQNRVIQRFGLSLFYLVCTIGIEIMTFAMLDIGFLPKYFMYDLGLILMFTGIIFIIPNYLAQYIVSMIILTAQTVIMYVNYTLYHLYGDIFSFDMVKLFNETKQAITNDFTYVWLIVFLVAMMIGIGVVGFFIYKAMRVYKIPFKKNFSIFMIMVVLIVQGLGLSIYTQQNRIVGSTADISDGDYVSSDAFFRDTTMFKMSSLKALGTYGYYVNNIMNVLSPKKAEVVVSQAVQYFQSGETYDSSSVYGVDADNNVIVIMMESLEWYAFSDGTYNSHTLNNELTPNIMRIINDGFIATDFFSKSKTNYSEGIGFLGSYPIGKYMQQVATESKKDYYGFSMPNVLNEQGYKTYYLHPNNASFYSRSATHKNLGFTNTYFGDDALDSNIKWGHWMKEENFVQYAIDDGMLIPTEYVETDAGSELRYTGEKFYAFYTSVSTHGPYVDNSSNADQDEYKDLVLNSEWYKNAESAIQYDEDILKYLVNYEAGVVGLDRALGLILNYLDEFNIYDDTTIVLYADHDAYYHFLANSIKGIPRTNYSSVELNTIPLIIKSKGLTDAINTKGYWGYNFSGEYTGKDNLNGIHARPDRYNNMISGTGKVIPSTSRFSSAYDIVPTLLDLLGIPFNQNFYAGHSLFSDISDSIELWEAEYKNEEIIAYYSHTGGVYGKYGYTIDMSSYSYDFGSVKYTEYEKKFEEVSKKLVSQLNYVSLLYSDGVYAEMMALRN